MDESKKNIQPPVPIFKENSSPTLDEVFDYINKQSNEAEKNAFEQKTIDEELYQEGLEGLTESEKNKQYKGIIQSLNNQISLETGATTPEKKVVQINYKVVSLIAASILIAVFLTIFYYDKENKTNAPKQLASSEKSKKIVKSEIQREPKSIKEPKKEVFEKEGDKQTLASVQEDINPPATKPSPSQPIEAKSTIEESKTKELLPNPTEVSLAQAEEIESEVLAEEINLAESATIAESNTTNEEKMVTRMTINNPESTVAIESQNIEKKETAAATNIAPQFPGGKAAMQAFIQSKLSYPKKEKENGIQGTVLTNVMIKKNGKIGSVNVINSVSDKLDDEAVKVIKSMPKWEPAKDSGEPVEKTVQIPVKFSL